MPAPDRRRRSPPNLYRYGYRADRCPWAVVALGGGEVSFLRLPKPFAERENQYTPEQPVGEPLAELEP